MSKLSIEWSKMGIVFHHLPIYNMGRKIHCPLNRVDYLFLFGIIYTQNKCSKSIDSFENFNYHRNRLLLPRGNNNDRK